MASYIHIQSRMTYGHFTTIRLIAILDLQFLTSCTLLYQLHSLRPKPNRVLSKVIPIAYKMVKYPGKHHSVQMRLFQYTIGRPVQAFLS